MRDCPFCAIVAGAQPARMVYADNHNVAFLPLHPATRGHTLVVPRSHAADFLALDAPAAARLSAAVLAVAAAVQDAIEPEGMNLITSAGAAAAQTVFHLHVHVLPRTTGDRVGDIWPADQPMSENEADHVQELIASAVHRSTGPISRSPATQSR